MPIRRLLIRAAPTPSRQLSDNDVLIERSNLERLMASAGLDPIIATDTITVAALAGYRSWLDGRFREFMVSLRGSGDLVRTYSSSAPVIAPSQRSSMHRSHAM